MLVFDLYVIGNKLLSARKRLGLTQAEVAEAAGISDRTYADIERGTVNMRIQTMLKICEVLQITPDNIFTEDELSEFANEEEILSKLNACNSKDKTTALQILSAYFKSL